MKERFWWGSIRTRDHAARVIRWAGGVFLAFGALSLSVEIPRADWAAILVGVACAVPGAVLLKNGSPLAAKFLLAASAALLLVSVVWGLAAVGLPHRDVDLPSMLFWAVLTALARRAVIATEVMRKLTAAVAPAPPYAP